jgi:hypothetical protein
MIGGQSADIQCEWEDIAKLGESLFGYKWTRQTLQSRDDIKKAYDAHTNKRRHVRKTGKLPPTKAPEVDVVEQKLAKLRTEYTALERTLKSYDELLVRYMHNAIRLGLSLEQLEAPLVKPERGQTGIARRRAWASSKHKNKRKAR